jgi:hypothetical protein
LERDLAYRKNSSGNEKSGLLRAKFFRKPKFFDTDSYAEASCLKKF